MGRTRVVATIGPASDSDEIIRALVDGGLDVARLNYSHGDHAGKNETYQRLRRIEAESGRPLGILADLPGPKLRLGRFEGHIDLVRGEEIDWAAIEEKYTPKRRCVRCSTVCFKDEFRPSQWNRKDKRYQCEDCVHKQQTAGTSLECMQCYIW
ncbi:MAG TPA: hypothetical protein EYQ00_02660 [Dehalococcoidia bacterium]|nr:hypothetical protein [Dehalococcoidia bacterium]